MIVENGTGLVDANSYVDIAYSDNYFTSHGVFAWSDLTEEQKEVLLIKATDYIDNVYQWLGTKLNKEQALRFPRENLYDYEGIEVTDIPKALKDAVCESVNVLMKNTELFQSVNENGAVTSEHIGELSFTYDVTQKIKDSTLFESINSRLRGLYKDSSKSKIYSAKVKRVL